MRDTAVRQWGGVTGVGRGAADGLYRGTFDLRAALARLTQRVRSVRTDQAEPPAPASGTPRDHQHRG